MYRLKLRHVMYFEYKRSCIRDKYVDMNKIHNKHLLVMSVW